MKPEKIDAADIKRTFMKITLQCTVSQALENLTKMSLMLLLGRVNKLQCRQDKLEQKKDL